MIIRSWIFLITTISIAFFIDLDNSHGIQLFLALVCIVALLGHWDRFFWFITRVRGGDAELVDRSIGLMTISFIVFSDFLDLLSRLWDI